MKRGHGDIYSVGSLRKQPTSITELAIKLYCTLYDLEHLLISILILFFTFTYTDFRHKITQSSLMFKESYQVILIAIQVPSSVEYESVVSRSRACACAWMIVLLASTWTAALILFIHHLSVMVCSCWIWRELQVRSKTKIKILSKTAADIGPSHQSI
jgi:hypothetical protein